MNTVGEVQPVRLKDELQTVQNDTIHVPGGFRRTQEKLTSVCIWARCASSRAVGLRTCENVQQPVG